VPISKRTTTTIKKVMHENLWGLRPFKALAGVALSLAAGYLYKK
jgi:hypothetical protein